MGIRRGKYQHYLHPETAPRRGNYSYGPTPEAFARAKELFEEMRRDKLTLEQLGSRHGISRQRVHQILTRNGFYNRKYSL